MQAINQSHKISKQKGCLSPFSLVLWSENEDWLHRGGNLSQWHQHDGQETAPGRKALSFKVTESKRGFNCRLSDSLIMIQKGFLLHVLPQGTLETIPSHPRRRGGQLTVTCPWSPASLSQELSGVRDLAEDRK